MGRGDGRRRILNYCGALKHRWDWNVAFSGSADKFSVRCLWKLELLPHTAAKVRDDSMQKQGIFEQYKHGRETKAGGPRLTEW